MKKTPKQNDKTTQNHIHQAWLGHSVKWEDKTSAVSKRHYRSRKKKEQFIFLAVGDSVSTCWHDGAKAVTITVSLLKANYWDHLPLYN